MPPKRKSKNRADGPSKRSVKDQRSVDTAKAIEEQMQNEARVVIKEKPLIKSHSSPKEEPEPEPASASARPMSAVAARKAAIDAGLYSQSSIDKKDENDLDNDMIVINDDDEEEDVDGEEHIRSPISGAATPREEFSPGQSRMPLNALNDIGPKAKKMPLLIDARSVSQFVPTSKNCCMIKQEDETYLFLGLKKGENILFMGQVLVAPVYGSIAVAGAVVSSGRAVPDRKKLKKEDLQVSFYPVFSPRTHSLLRISSAPLDAPSVTLHEDNDELDEYLIGAAFDDLFKSNEEFESIVVIKDFVEDTGFENAREVIGSSKKSLVKFTKKESNRDESLAINLLHSFHPIFSPTPGVKALQIDSSWEACTTLALENAARQERELTSIVCGAKDTGKSSFSRYLINRLLARYKCVAYIETDVGQSEFTPAGLLSLHFVTQPILGPPYTHQQLESERSFFFGSTSPRHNPDYYLACVYELINHWKQSQANDNSTIIPLVVNTQGWVSGMGYNLLIDIIRKVMPTDIFAMHHPVFSYKNMPPVFQEDVMLPPPNSLDMIRKEPPSIHYLSSLSSLSSLSLQEATAKTTLSDTFTATQQRDIVLASYFYQSGMGQEHYIRPNWDFKQHLTARVPWVIDWRHSLKAIWVIYEEVKMNELFYALNGSLVGLIGDVVDYKSQPGPSSRKHDNDDDTFTPPNYCNDQDQLSPQPQSTTCHGLAIVRAIDPSRHALLLLTPVSSSKLKNVSGLVKGELQLPVWALYNEDLDKQRWHKIPYITQESTEGAGANTLRVRRNLLRRSQQQ